jgi:hypothetical protein
MKAKQFKISVATLFFTFILVSCGKNSIESDAKKMAALQCETQQLMEKAAGGDISIMAESAELSSKASALSKEIEGKYTSDSDKREFAEALLKEMGNCK